MTGRGLCIKESRSCRYLMDPSIHQNKLSRIEIIWLRLPRSCGFSIESLELKMTKFGRRGKRKQTASFGSRAGTRRLGPASHNDLSHRVPNVPCFLFLSNKLPQQVRGPPQIRFLPSTLRSDYQGTTLSVTQSDDICVFNRAVSRSLPLAPTLLPRYSLNHHRILQSFQMFSSPIFGSFHARMARNSMTRTDMVMTKES